MVAKIKMEIQLNTKNDKQIQAVEYWIDDSVDEILYGGAKGGGKSYLGCALIFADALIYPETHYFIARKELTDLRKFTLASVNEVFKHWGLDIKYYAPYNDQSHCFNLHNGSKVFFIACPEVPSDPLFERFGSMQMTRGWIEEAGEVAESARSNLWLSIGRWKNKDYNLKKKLLITANPKKGWMKRDFVDPFKQGMLAPARKYIQAFATDNIYLTDDYVESLKNEKDNVRRQRLWEGNWDYDDDMDSLVSSDALSDAFSNTITSDGERYLVVDVARLGRDRIVITLWNGLELIKIWVFEKQSTEVTKDKIRDIAAIERVPYSHILVDEDGIGGAVVDGLIGVKGFTANSTPIFTASQIRERQSKIEHSLITKPTFSNLKAQCGWKMAELINEHKTAFKVPEYRDEIIEELSALLRDKHVDGDGKKQLKPKEEVKELLGKSPDIGDTILMRAWFELKHEALNEDPKITRMTIERQQDQFARTKRQQSLNSTK